MLFSLLCLIDSGIMPQTLLAPAHHELIVKKSRFLACVQPMPDRAGAQQVVAALRARHPGANHVCWALLAGGQSSGTAGRPMLDVLRHQDLEGVLATVVRYFGGVKLGAGGLVRAYTDSVAQALLGAQKVPIVVQRSLRCSVPYQLEGLLRRELDGAGATLEHVEHGDAVDFAFRLPLDRVPGLIARLNEAGNGRLVWTGDPSDQCP
jgi:putative IMPACT (imprinted ancient) family translation regulator